MFASWCSNFARLFLKEKEKKKEKSGPSKQHRAVQEPVYPSATLFCPHGDCARLFYSLFFSPFSLVLIQHCYASVWLHLPLPCLRSFSKFLVLSTSTTSTQTATIMEEKSRCRHTVVSWLILENSVSSQNVRYMSYRETFQQINVGFLQKTKTIR